MNTIKIKMSWLLKMLTTCVMAGPSLPASAAAIEGSWERGEMRGVEAVSDKCSVMWTVNRVLTVKRVPDGTLLATYMADEQRNWAFKADLKCKTPGGGMSNDAYKRVRFWNVALTPRGPSSWNMLANFAACQGDGCEASDTAQQFRTGLTLVGDTLREDELDSDGLMFVYKRSEALRSRENEAAVAFQKLMRPLDAGNCNEFVAESLIPDSPVRQYQGPFCQNNARLMATFPKVSRTNPLLRIAVDKIPIDGKPRAVEDVLIFGFLEFQSGTTAIRTGHLRKINDRWHLVTHFGL